jgi:hypothetical protein
MSTYDDIDLLLRERFDARAQAVRPLADPGAAILERSGHIARRRRDRRIGITLAALAIVVLTGLLTINARHSGTRLRTADGSTTTAVPGCAVADTCTPTSVSSVVVGSVPSSYVVSTEPPPAAPPGQTVVELIYNSTVPPAHRLGNSANQLVIRVATASASDTASIAKQVGSWSAVDVGPRKARAITVTNGAGTPAATSISYLQIQLSPTVTLSINGATLTTDQLVAVALTITLQ